MQTQTVNNYVELDFGTRISRHVESACSKAADLIELLQESCCAPKKVHLQEGIYGTEASWESHMNFVNQLEDLSCSIGSLSYAQN